MRLSHRALMSGLTGKFKWGRRSRNAKMVRYKGTERGDCSSGAASGTKGGEKSLHRGDWVDVQLICCSGQAVSELSGAALREHNFRVQDWSAPR